MCFGTLSNAPVTSGGLKVGDKVAVSYPRQHVSLAPTAPVLPVTTTVPVLRTGDTVKVVREIKSFENGWRNSWVPDMTKQIGQVGKVVHVYPEIKDIEVKFDNGQIFGFPKEALEKIAELPAPVTGPFVIEYSWEGEKARRSCNTYSKGPESLAHKEFSDLQEATTECALQQKKMGIGYNYIVRDLKTGNTYQGLPTSVKADAAAISQNPITNQKDALQLAKGLAVAKALQNTDRQTNMDLVQEELTKHGVGPALLGNSAGQVFKSKDWINTRVTVKSTRPGNRHRKIAVWQYRGV